MRYFWSALFGVVAVLCTVIFLYAPLNTEFWLPNWSASNPVESPAALGRPLEDAASGSTLGRKVDHLFVLILVITGVTFVGTQIALVYVTQKFADAPGRKAVYTHGSHKLEIIWSVIPAAILVFIAVYQLGTWAEIKFQSAAPRVEPLAEITGRQFQWIIKYPGPDGKLNTIDDVHMVNDLHFVKDRPVLIQLKSSDVLHSFFLPQMRIKQDAVPGLTIPVWFDADRAGHFELVCAELCGWGHYKMRADVTVHSTQAEFDEWMKRATEAQSADGVTVAAMTGGK